VGKVSNRCLLGRHAPLALSALSSVVIAVSFFVDDLWWLSLVALSPVITGICLHKRKGLYPALSTWVFAFLMHLLLNLPLVPTIISLRSIIALPTHTAFVLSIFVLLLLAVFQSLFFMPLGFISLLASLELGEIALAFLFACGWALAEWARSLGLMGSQWVCIAHAILPCTTMLQLAELVGVYGLCFCVVFANGLFAMSLCAVLKREWRRALFGVTAFAVLLLSWFFYGKWAMHQYEEELKDARKWSYLKVAIIQGNLSWREKVDKGSFERAFELHMDMTAQALTDHPKIVVWPETTITAPLNEWDKAKLELSDLARKHSVDLLIGAVERDRSGKIYNSCYGITAKGEFIGTYRKLRLVPFGEFVPLRKHVRFFERFAAHPQDFTHGEFVKPLRLQNTNAALAICFDSLFPWITRLQVLRGANSLVIITNDEWFWGEWMAREHADVAKLRAVESRLFLVRAANSGISCIVNPLGKVEASLNLRERGKLIGTVGIPRGSHETFYVRFGDMVQFTLTLLTATLTIIAFVKLCLHRPSTSFQS